MWKGLLPIDKQRLDKPGRFTQRSWILNRHMRWILNRHLRMTEGRNTGAYDHQQTKESCMSIQGVQQGYPRRAAEAWVQKRNPIDGRVAGQYGYERVTKVLHVLRDCEEWKELSTHQ